MEHHGNFNIDGDNHTFYLVGNPNVGKSVIFTLLTDKYATASNYPGTTVEVTTGHISARFFGKEKIRLVDTPGINSLVPLSEDEKVTRDILIRHERATGKMPGVILVIDAKNLRRGLILALQLSYAGIPFVVAMNMMDEANSLGIQIDIKKLRNILGVPVIPTIAIQKEGIGALIRAVKQPFQPSRLSLELHKEVQEGLVDMIRAVNHPLLALSVYYGEMGVRGLLNDEQICSAEETLAKYNLNIHKLQLVWMENANKLQAEVYHRDTPSQSGWLTKLGTWSIRPASGFFILLGVIYLVYKFVGILGAGIAVDFLEKVVFGKYLIPAIAAAVSSLPIPQLLIDLLVGEFGLISMGITYALALILPIVFTFFIAFSFLEDSGYLPRMGSLLNSSFKTMGLNGKAILPMVLGLGCDTMATMTARVMETRKERILVTLLLALGVPCSAQLGVILAFGAYIPFGYMLTWVLILFFTLASVGYLASKVLPGQVTLFLLELPPLRVPQFGNILRKTYMRSKWYLKEAVPIFLIGTFILFVLHESGAITFLNKWLETVTVNGLGLPPESAGSFVMGFLRRDFGAAGFLHMYERGMLNPRQVLVSLVVITLFIPCIANLLMIIKERGMKVALSIFFFIIPFSFLMGTLLNHTMKLFGL